MNSELLIIAVAVFGLVLCGGYVLTLVLDRYSAKVDARLQGLNRPKESGSKKAGGSPGRCLAHVSGAFNRLVPNSVQDRRHHQLRLVQAGIYSPAALSTFFAAKLALMIVPPIGGLLVGVLGYIDVRFAALGGCSIGGLGMFFPSVWLDRQIRQRHTALRKALADFLDLMIVCLDSGLSLQATIQRVSDELRIAHPLLAGELNIVQRDIELGASVDSAVRRFADRSGYDGIKMLSTFMRESQRFGTALSEALRVHADMLRMQREQAAEELAQKAAVKVLIPTLLLILPAVFVVVAGPAAIQIQEAFSK